MPKRQPHRNPEEHAQLGTEIYQRAVRPALKPDDYGRFVAIHVETGDYEIHKDDYPAVMNLRARHPPDVFWLEQVGGCWIRTLGDLPDNSLVEIANDLFRPLDAEESAAIPGEAALLTEVALAADRLRPEEDAAWSHLRPGK